MKAFIFDLINKLQRTSNSLDTKAIICNKTWRVFSDSGEKEVYIFMEDGKLIISVNGAAVIGSWMYIPANQSLVISGNNQNFLVHPIICNNVLVLALDGSNKCCFLLDSTKAELDRIQSLRSIETYINENANIIPILPKRNVVKQKPIPSDAIYTTDSRLIEFEFELPNGDLEEIGLHIKGLFTYKKFIGTLYSSGQRVEFQYGNGWNYNTRIYHKNKQLAIEVENHHDEDEDVSYFDENGYELSADDFEEKYGNFLEDIEDELDEIYKIPIKVKNNPNITITRG